MVIYETGMNILKLNKSQPEYLIEDLLGYIVAREVGELGPKLQRTEVKISFIFVETYHRKPKMREHAYQQRETDLPCHEDIQQILVGA